MSLLFLDFDGVLHPEPCYRDEDLFCRRPLFEAVMREAPSVEIVITSTWRETRDLETLRGFFSDDIAVRIIGVTPSWLDLLALAEEIGPTYLRQIEIEGFLRQQNRVWESWIALDDKAHWFRPFLPNLVLCDAKTGLCEQSAATLRRRLR